MRWLSLRLLALGLAAGMLPPAHAQGQKVSLGESLFNARCGGCHSLDAADERQAVVEFLARASGMSPVR